MQLYMKIKFEKTQGLWYAILPEYLEAGGDFNDCLMVENAPEMLDILSGFTNDVSLILSDKELSDSLLLLEKDREQQDWAYYNVQQNKYNFNLQVGLCPVNKFVWKGIHPKQIWITL